MKYIYCLPLLLSPMVALGGPASDFSIRSITASGGIQGTEPVVLEEAFDSLVRDLGTAISVKPSFPAETPGASGFDVSFGSSFIFLEQPTEGQTNHWQRATGDQDYNSFLYIPSLTARKGLPMSMELGATASWLMGSEIGAFGGFFRAAVVEGYKPWPDITLHGGFTGLVGHPELDLAVVTTGVTLGSTYAFGSVAGIRQAQVSPWLDFTLLQKFTKVRVDPNTREDLFGELEENAGEDKRGQKYYGPAPQIGGGIQITNSTVLFRIASTWTPQSVPTLFVAMGFTY